MNLDELRKFKPQIEALLVANHATNPRIFGSVARGEETKDSDIDLLVSLKPEASLFDIAGLYVDLEDLLKCRVDVVPDESVDPLISAHVFRDAVVL